MPFVELRDIKNFPGWKRHEDNQLRCPGCGKEMTLCLDEIPALGCIGWYECFFCRTWMTRFSRGKTLEEAAEKAYDTARRKK